MITITNLTKMTQIIPAGLPGGGSLCLAPEGTAKVTMVTEELRKVISSGRLMSDEPPPPPMPEPPPSRKEALRQIKWRSVEERTRLVLELAAEGKKHVEIAAILGIDRIWVGKAIRESQKAQTI